MAVPKKKTSKAKRNQREAGGPIAGDQQIRPFPRIGEKSAPRRDPGGRVYPPAVWCDGLVLPSREGRGADARDDGILSLAFIRAVVDFAQPFSCSVQFVAGRDRNWRYGLTRTQERAR